MMAPISDDWSVCQHFSRCRVGVNSKTQQTGILSHVLMHVPVTMKAITNSVCVVSLVGQYLHGSTRVFMHTC